MKKLLWMALLAVAFSANAYADGDDEKKETDIVLSKSKNHSLEMHFGAGVNIVSGAPDGYEFATFSSWDFQFTPFQYEYKPEGASQTYSVGLGFNWRNYGLKDNNTCFEKIDDVVMLREFPINSGERASKVHTFAINIPLLFTQNIGKNFSISVGPIVNFNVSGWVTNDYELNNKEFKVTTRKIGQRPVTVDIMGIFDIYGLGVFCKYSPMNVFKKDRGPEFRSFTVGLYI